MMTISFSSAIYYHPLSSGHESLMLSSVFRYRQFIFIYRVFDIIILYHMTQNRKIRTGELYLGKESVIYFISVCYFDSFPYYFIFYWFIFLHILPSIFIYLDIFLYFILCIYLPGICFIDMITFCLEYHEWAAFY